MPLPWVVLIFLIFTGGIGENGSDTRENICSDFEFMGIEFDKTVNDGVQR